MIVILVGESASGKTSLANEFVKRNPSFDRVVTYTTRPKRINEIDGLDYHFITNEEFYEIEKQNLFIESATYNGWNYGTSKISFSPLRNYVVILTPAGMREFKKMYADNSEYRTIYLCVDRRTRLIETLKRGDNIEEAYRRSLSDVGQFDNVRREVDIVIENEEHMKSIGKLCEELENRINV